MNCLLVTRDVFLLRDLSEKLSANGFEVASVPSAALAVRMTSREIYKVYVIDVDAYALLSVDQVQQLVGADDRVVIFLARNPAIEDKLAAYKLGVDDYLEYPISADEIQLRVEVIAARKLKIFRGSWCLGELRYLLKDQLFYFCGRPLQIGNYAQKVLLAMMRRSPRVVSIRELHREAYGSAGFSPARIRSHIHQIRTELHGVDGANIIETVPFHGYRLIA
ncbi:TPA: response regulator transcription factor [Pseudomonas aeruginosa]|nr:response regulator transcription factor [Pseudomonas aeruginosa]HBO3334046.1 response regulator transcription factor [Pseudomonas aeruginosa]